MDTGKILIAAMVASAIGMMYGLSKQKAGALWGKPVATICAIIALGCALGHIALTSGGQDTQKIVQIEREYQRISGEKLGRYLAEAHPDAVALIIADPSTPNTPDAPDALLDGIKQGLGEKVRISAEVRPQIPEAVKKQFAGETPEGMPAEEALPPMEFWFTAAMMDSIIAKDGKGCDLIITTIGLPTDMAKMKFWRSAPSNGTKLAIARGSVYELKRAIAQKLVTAAISFNPNAVWDDKSPSSDLDEAFAKRYLLITPENVEELATKYPNALFMK